MAMECLSGTLHAEDNEDEGITIIIIMKCYLPPISISTDYRVDHNIGIESTIQFRRSILFHPMILW